MIPGGRDRPYQASLQGEGVQAIKCIAVQCSAKKCIAAHCKAVQCSTLQCIAVLSLVQLYTRQFVESGGSYLGLCAGAYFAAARVSFQPGTDLQVQYIQVRG